MVTFAQAQERAERWVNDGVPAYQHREVHVREFDLGFVAWAEDREDGPTSDGGNTRLVIARDSGDSTLWPGLPVGEVIRRYEEQYATAAKQPAPAPAQRVDLEATSFLLTPPEWLQQAADRMGVPDNRPTPPPPATQPAPPPPPTAQPSTPPPPSAQPATPPPASPVAPGTDSSGGGSGAVSWADTSDSGAGPALRPPATVFAPPISGSDEEEPPRPRASAEAKTELLPDGSSLPRTQLAPALPDPNQSSGGQTPPPAPPIPSSGGGVHHAATMLTGPTDPSSGGNSPVPPPPSAPSEGGASSIADADTSRAPRPAPPAPGRAARPARGGSGVSVPPPPGAPGTPGARTGAGAGSGPGAYEPTQLVSADDVVSQGRQDNTPAPGEPTPPPPPGGGPSSGGGVHHAATMLAGPGGPMGPAGAPSPPQAPGPPPGQQQSAGYPPQPTGQPMVGPGYMAVLTYRAQDGSEQKLIRRAAPGLPHPEWQIMHELRGMNIPPEQVLELHTELECCDLPGGYCARMVQETWPQVRISHTAPYGRDHATRQQGMRHLVEHQGELHQVADAPARHAPERAALVPVQAAPPIPLDGIGHELAQAFGPQGVFHFDQMAVSRQGVPDVVAQTLMWSGLPMDVNPFFWAQAQPGRPVPTLAELAQERGVHPASDSGSYLVVGSDYGRQLCVQYGTAHIVAVPLEAGPGGHPATPQFVNTGLPEFARCLAMLGRMWPLRYGLTPDQAGRWTVDFQQQLAALDPAALGSPETWWSVLLEQLWDGLL